MPKQLANRYDHRAAESTWYERWIEEGLFHADPEGGGEPFVIVIPPPNVTGALHMGHALNNTIQDVLVRYRRMEGRNTLWMPGTDHAGIATQNVVERELAEQGLDRKSLGREAFVEKVWEWKGRYEARILGQLRRLGCSCDWDRTRFTMDEGLSRAVREVFVRLHEEGLIYKGAYLVNWCPGCQTALSDEEVEHRDETGKLWYIRYPVKGERGHVTVATTRPETMLGDTAVAVNPEDGRYRSLVGKTLVLPVIGREIPVISDPSIDPEFGSGAVKVTPAHDPADFRLGLAHKLPQVNVMNPDGTMNDEAGKYRNQDRFVCRRNLLADLEELKLLAKTEEHAHAVGACYRCSTVVEPIISEQWFVKMKPLAEEAIAAAEDGRLRFHPARWSREYLRWMGEIRDWCISRQIWWGHQIPAWHCRECGRVTVALDAPEECAGCDSKSLQQDQDVLDTWFSSALWPFSTMGWPDRTKELAAYYPTSVLVTDRGIIYFWVARMAMMGLKFMREVPFRDVYIHGTVLDEIGRKMSKSLGNGIDPIEMIETYGADAVRFSLMMLTAEGQDVKLSPTKFEMGRNFGNKVWNAARFALMELEKVKGESLRRGSVPEDLAFEDRWILSRLARTVAETTGALDEFRLNEAARILYDFAWRDFCDWYLEAIKFRLRDPERGAGGAQAARIVLAHVLDAIVRLLHPFMPFLTEEIWSALGEAAPERGIGLDPEESRRFVMASSWPVPDGGLLDEAVEAGMAFAQEFARGIRNIRSKMHLPPRESMDVAISVAGEEDAELLRPRLRFISEMTGSNVPTLAVGARKPPSAAVEVIGKHQVFVPLPELRVEEEKKRLRKQLESVRTSIEKCATKLQTSEFLDKAPREIVERERRRRAELVEEMERLRENLESLS